MTMLPRGRMVWIMSASSTRRFSVFMTRAATGPSSISSASRGAFPHATWRRPDGQRTPGNGLVRQRLPRHGPASGGAGRDARGAGRDRRRVGRHPQHLGHDGLSQAAGGRTGRPARQGSGAAVHLGLHRQRRHAVDAAQAVSRPDHLFRRAEPRLDDRGHPPQRRAKADLPAQRSRRICAQLLEADDPRKRPS